MDNPFSADSNSPFQAPFQQPGQAAAGIKPFAAVDLAPTAGPGGNRHPAAPLANPFAGGDFSTAFMAREAPLPPLKAMPTTAPEAAPPGPAIPVPAAPLGKDFAIAPMPDFSPAPLAAPASPPAAARRSQILAMSDFNEAPESRKPEFFLTTTPAVEGHRIRSFAGLVSVEIVVPKDLLFQNPAPYGELHRIKAAEDKLQKVKEKAFEELADQARRLGADGIVGVTLQFSQFDAIVCLCSAMGTAVKLD